VALVLERVGIGKMQLKGDDANRGHGYKRSWVRNPSVRRGQRVL
jgi:hypothetical protein